MRWAQDYRWAWCFPPLLWRELDGLACGADRSPGHMSVSWCGEYSRKWQTWQGLGETSKAGGLAGSGRHGWEQPT